MSLSPKQIKRQQKMHSKPTMKRWLIFGSLILSALLVFFVIGATHSTELNAVNQQAANQTLSDATVNNQTQTINYTESLAQNFAKEISSQLDLSQISAENIDATETVDAFKTLDFQKIEQYMSTIDTDKIFGVSINDADILVSTDNSKNAVVSYLTELSDIIIKTKKPLLKDMASLEISKDNPGPMVMFGQEAAQKLQDAYLEAKKLIVPSILKEEHKKELGLILGQKNIFEALADFQTDPYKALLATTHLNKIQKSGAELEQNIKSIFAQNFNVQK